MYTATSKQILEPVAEAISTLIIFNVEAESKNAPMPDLTDVAKSVANQAKQLTDAGKSMITDPGDEQLKKEITAACAKGSLVNLSTDDYEVHIYA
jgi:rRNA maturation endonuclease Nob1